MSIAFRLKIIVLLGLSSTLFIITLRFLSIIRNDISDPSYRIIFNTLNILGSINLILLSGAFFINRNAILGSLKGGLLLAAILAIMNKVKGHDADYTSIGDILISSIVIGTTIELIRKTISYSHTNRHLIGVKTQSNVE